MKKWWKLKRDKGTIHALTLAEGMEALKRQKWIPCSERLPKDWEKVLTYTHDGHYMSMQKFDAGGWLCDGWIVEDALVTHWMPLPEPPEEGVGENGS